MFRFTAPRRLALAACVALSVAGPATAQSKLTLQEALSRTLKSNPDLAAYQYVLKAQEGRISQAGMLPNPQLSTTFENAFGTGEAKGTDAAELTLSLSQLIELGGLRSKRVAVAQSERDGLEVDAHIRRLDVVADTARKFVSLVAQQEEHRLTHLAVELAQKTSAAVDRRVEAAKSPLAERDRAAAALERAKVADAHAEHLLVTARYELAATWGANQPDFVDVQARLFELPPIADFETLVTELEMSPDFTRYLAEGRLRDSEITLALASRLPGLEVGAGVRQFRATNDTGMVFSVGLPLPVFNRNQGQIAEAQARKAGTEAVRKAALLKARTQLFTNYRELIDRNREVVALSERAVPRMESALKNTEYAYERGRYSYLELVDAQRELLAAKRELISAAEQYHLTLIEIERLTGTAMSR